MHKIWELEGTAVPIISPAHEPEHGAAKCRFNEQGKSDQKKKKAVFTSEPGALSDAVTQIGK